MADIDQIENGSDDGARSFVRLGLMQSDMNADGYKITNLDTSNLIIPGIPSQSAPNHTWFNSYDMGSHTFGSRQPDFTDIKGTLTTGPHGQQRGITEVGTIRTGSWHATALEPLFVPKLNAILPPVANVFLNNQKITMLADSVDPQDAVNLRILRQISSRNPKAAVLASTDTHIIGGLTPPVDGVTISDGDRILITDAVSGYNNGIWIAHSGAWTRPPDFDDGAPGDDSELIGATVFVLQGNTNAGSTWFQSRTTPVYIRPDVSERYPDFVKISTGTTIIAGVGLAKFGNTIAAVGTANRIAVAAGIDIASNYVGQSSITTLGTITTGNWQGSTITGAHGGTGVANTGKTISLDGSLSVQLNVDAVPNSALTFNISAETVVNLPFTGTLATLAGDETFTNKHINASQIDSGLLPVVRGGTGGVNAKAAMQNLLPSQTGHAGHFLTTDGAGNLSWAVPGV